jgi:hypothetical protein
MQLSLPEFRDGVKRPDESCDLWSRDSLESSGMGA